jgi:hypothetical protein
VESLRSSNTSSIDSMRRHPDSKEVDYDCSSCGKHCHKLISASSLRDGHVGKYCSRACMVIFMQKNARQITCEICLQVKKCKPRNQVSKGARFCSKKCKGIWMTLEAKKRHATGLTTLGQFNRFERYSKAAGEWRKAIFARDNFTCQICKVRGTYLEADHIKPFAYFPSLRYDIDNGRTLCRPCHDKTKVSYKTLRKIYAKEAEAVQKEFASQAKTRTGEVAKTDSDKEIRERLLYLSRPQFTRKKLSSRTCSMASKHPFNRMQVRLPLYADTMHGR